MQQYRIEFFELATISRKLRFVYRDFSTDLAIDDDYIAIQTTVVEINATELVRAGQFIRILRDEEDYFFGIVSDAEPGTYTTRVSFRPFLSIFDADILFNVLNQWRDDNITHRTLENTLLYYINSYFIDNDDNYQNYPVSSVTLTSSTVEWNMGIVPDNDDTIYASINLYRELIVRALKEFGVAINVIPEFSQGTFSLKIGTFEEKKHIDADLKNVNIRTFKVNERPTGVNKLIVYNAKDYSMSPITYYVHPDRKWNDRDEDRILPVSYTIRTVTPDETFSDPQVDFAYAALTVAYDELNGLEWDNLIELEVAPNDPIVQPTKLENGQQVAIYHNGTQYVSILTGKSISFESILLVFGSERISYTKKSK